MFGNKKNVKPKRDRTGRNLAQFGLFDMSNDYGAAPDDDNDSDLEAELSNLVGGNGANKRQAPPKKVIPDADLNAMVAESMKDIPSDAELSGDDDDPDLLNELNEITGGSGMDTSIPVASPNQADDGGSDLVKLLSERLKMYEEAEKNAQASGESSRARRFHRGLNTIQDMLKQARAGRNVNQDDIPPEVATGPRKPADAAAAAPQPNRPAPSVPVPEPVKPPSPEPIPTPEPQETPPEAVDSPSPTKPTVDVALVNMLQQKKKQFKIAALRAKKSGDTATALSYIKTAKQFDHVIAAAESGQPVDLSSMPDPPPDPAAAASKVEENQTQADSDLQAQPQLSEEPAAAPPALVMASSVGEALQQRLEIYVKQEKAAEEAGNSSKQRRMGRIVKQYEQAIKLHKAGKPIPVEDLPTPPGYGPIPVTGAEIPKAAAPQPPKPSVPAPAEQTPSPEEQPKTSPSRPSTSHSTRISGNKVPNSRADKQLALLLAKQKEFKLAALHAKQKGEIEQAKEFLRTAKGFDPLIDAANCGLPVDLSTIPVSPAAKSQLDDEYDVVMADDCNEEGNNENADVISRLESQLTKQLKMCLSTRDHHKALGDVGGTNRFERLALSVTKDLDLVRLAHRTAGAGVPKFHYETKDFSIVKSFTELNDNDLELTILRGISYTCANPKDIDTYVKFEFPFPQEAPFGDRTATVRDTNSPEYNATFTLPIQRTARACQRVFKRHPIKFEIYSKGGFFRGDTLIGTVNVKLQPLETQCELHDSFDLLDGRKKVGGKLEVRLRLRHPIVSQQVEQLHEKWLVIDN